MSNKIYFIEDENGRYVSEDGTRRFTKLVGREAYDFLHTPAGENRRFIKFSSSAKNGEEINIELQNDEPTKIRTYERRKQYVVDVERKWSYDVLSLDYEENSYGESLRDAIPDEQVNVEKEVIERLTAATLRQALSTLTKEEYNLIYALYLDNCCLSEHEYAKITGIPQKTISNRKIKILKKLKKFF